MPNHANLDIESRFHCYLWVQPEKSKQRVNAKVEQDSLWYRYEKDEVDLAIEVFGTLLIISLTIGLRD